MLRKKNELFISKTKWIKPESGKSNFTAITKINNKI